MFAWCPWHPESLPLKVPRLPADREGTACNRGHFYGQSSGRGEAVRTSARCSFGPLVRCIGFADRLLAACCQPWASGRASCIVRACSRCHQAMDRARAMLERRALLQQRVATNEASAAFAAKRPRTIVQGFTENCLCVRGVPLPWDFGHSRPRGLRPQGRTYVRTYVPSTGAHQTN